MDAELASSNVMLAKGGFFSVEIINNQIFNLYTSIRRLHIMKEADSIRDGRRSKEVLHRPGVQLRHRLSSISFLKIQSDPLARLVTELDEIGHIARLIPPAGLEDVAVEGPCHMSRKMLPVESRPGNFADSRASNINTKPVERFS